MTQRIPSDPSRTNSNTTTRLGEKRPTSDNNDEGSDNVVSFSGKVSQAWDGAVEGASQFVHQAQDWATHTGENVTTTVKRFPLQTLAAGFGVGCLVGILLSRRGHA